MSYLNPSNISTDLGIDLDPLRSLRGSAAAEADLDRIALAQAAQAAGADAVSMSLFDPLSKVDVAEFEQLMVSVMLNVDSVIAPSLASIAFACRVLPHTVKILPVLCQSSENQWHFDAADFGLVKQLLAQLRGTGSRVVVTLPPLLQAVDVAHAEGFSIVELDARRFAMAENSAAASAALTDLQHAAAAALRHGMAVHVGGGVNYRNMRNLAALGVFHQINCGHAVAVHALTVGWTRAVADMKALTVPSASSQRVST